MARGMIIFILSSVYGQEGTTTTLKLAKMNLAIRGIFANFGVKADDTFERISTRI